ncbi:thyrotropin-releasing hormone receptor [Rhipicephalus sanguineus]|uniref:thyrotropin-releasing hormone receptor n=1 Tax=Rhipicephalus sanguineus TaxID=34632 RepID=UPI001894FE38|nr:thyrotropin-releasing hormone receptor [Rhipicephalus sanguineus]
MAPVVALIVPAVLLPALVTTELTTNAPLWDGGWNNTTTAVAPPPEPNRTYQDPTYYSVNYRIIGTIFQGIIFAVGVLGNIMVVIVVMRTRSMHTPTNCYLVSLSVADFMVLVASVPNEIISYYVLGDEWIWGRAGCALFIFLQYLGINASSLSITAFTVERYIAICLPMKAQTMCTVKRAKKIILGVWLFACSYCSPWLALTTTTAVYYKGHDNIETCTFALSRHHYRSYFFADIILFYVVPLLLSCVLYGLMARVLFQSNFNSKANGTTDSKKSSANSSSRVQVVKMLFVVVAVFATLWLPYRVLLVYNSFAEKRYMELWYLMFCKTMIFINSAINPILYNAMSIKFRRAFKRMLSCGAARGSRDSRGGTERTVAGTYSSVVGGGSVRLNRSTFVAPPGKGSTSKNTLVDTTHQLV